MDMSFTTEKYKKDIDDLVSKGEQLLEAVLFECAPSQMREEYKTEHDYNNAKDALPNFRTAYQSWYSEAKIIVKHLLPDRLDDFRQYYEKPKNRKIPNSENYCIDDFLQGIQVISSVDGIVVDTTAAISPFTQQLAIIKGLRNRFESSLYDIRHHLQAEMFDDELEAAEYLLENGFIRAAGAMAGVVLERHLKEVCSNHKINLPQKKHLTISDFNDTLKKAIIIDTPNWRRIQLLGDIRNKCDHDKATDPTHEDVRELLEGVTKVVKTLF